MTTFTVWKFDETDGAGRAELALRAAEAEGLVTIVDHAVLSWPTDSAEPDLLHEHDSSKRGAAWVCCGACSAVRSSRSRSPVPRWVPASARS